MCVLGALYVRGTEKLEWVDILSILKMWLMLLLLSRVISFDENYLLLVLRRSFIVS